MSSRQTVIAHGRLAMRQLRLEAARERRQGLQVMTLEQMAARLAGGFTGPIDDELLRNIIQAVLQETELGELDGIRRLPGMVDATADTLRKAWYAGIDLRTRAAEHPRLASIAKLEEAVLAQLPAASMRPVDLVAAALGRIHFAATLFGPVDIVGITELAPCWRPLLFALTEVIPVRWIAGPRSVPLWLDGSAVAIVRSPRHNPEVNPVSAATAYHEAVETVRWVRSLLASGHAEPQDIAIASVMPADYDDHFLALRADANIDFHFVHGIKVTASREGQAAAALADMLLRGLSQTRMRRLASLLVREAGPFNDLPSGWTRILPTDAPLTSPEAWTRLLDQSGAEDWPDGVDHAHVLRSIVGLLAHGITDALKIGETLLSGRALAIWHKALLAGPAASLDATLESLRQDDGLEACVSVAWMPASALAASPRRFVRLLGLNSSRWPRGISEDRLLSDHIIPITELDPLPVGTADRRDFQTILATTEQQVILSRARRDADGRLLGRSTLLQGLAEEQYLRRTAIPGHAFSETDRLMARPGDFQLLPQAVAANTCWRNWHSAGLTSHDGLVRADHPVILSILSRTQSASSLRQLLRNPLGFVWQYGLRWRTPENGTDPLILDALAMGELVHMTLDQALKTIEASGGLAAAGADRIQSAVNLAADETAQIWEAERAVPPLVIWRRTLDEARELSRRGLAHRDIHLVDPKSYGEVPFGGAEPKSTAILPWDATAVVEIPGTGFHIAGYIDRLDISGDGHTAIVRDYKTGQPPKNSVTLDGGKELQRCLYAFAAKALMGKHIAISASLLYLRDETELDLEDPEATLIEAATFLNAARTSLRSGNCVIGPSSGGGYDDLAFALPANAAPTYCQRKISTATERLGAAANVWEAP